MRSITGIIKPFYPGNHLYHSQKTMNYQVLIFCVFLLVWAGCGQGKKTDTLLSTNKPTLSRTQVVAGAVSIRPISETLRMNAVTTYVSRENIRATTTGYVNQTRIQQGSWVKSGQLLYKLKTKEAEALGDEILNDPDINIKGIIPISAKKDGAITQVFYQDGDYVVDGDVLAELVRPNSLAIKLYVPYEYNQYVKLQKQVSINLPDGETLKGIIRQLLPSEEVISQTTPYLVSISPFKFLPENLNVTVTVPVKSNNQALVVPAQALQSNEEQTDFWVMKIVNDSLAIRYPVVLGIRTDSIIELKNSGLLPVDRIVLQGAYGLPDTASIALVNIL